MVDNPYFDMTTEEDIARRIVELDDDLDKIISFRGERLAEEMDAIEFYAPPQQDGIIKKTAKVGAGAAVVGVGGLAAKSAYDSRAGRFDSAPSVKGGVGGAPTNTGMQSKVKAWKGKSFGKRMGSQVQSNLRKVDKIPGIGKAGLGGKAAGLVGKGIKRLFGR